ncbi:TetR/AcrR family transcriptional regulator [Dongia sp.]|uniref:TetR/AcrR family transcriptional regulator n=1 Tax=Dongia sp. TaxID=1977262 RepID=UPI0037510B3B
MSIADPDILEDETEAGCPKDAGGEACTAARRRDKEATKQALIAAAVQVFAQRGFDGATTKEVAARAGVNEGLIQRYFGGKAGLLQAIVGNMCGERLTACRAAPPSDSLKAEIATVLRHEILQADANRDFLRVFISRALVDPALAASLKAHYKESRMPHLVHRLQHFRDNGTLDPAVDLAQLAASITTFAFGLGFMQQVVLSEDPKVLEGMIDGIAETIVRGTAARE